MHWEFEEVLTLISGVVIIACGLAVSLLDTPDTPQQRQRSALVGVAGGLVVIAYAFYMASTTSGVIIIPVGFWAGAGVFVTILYRADQEAKRKRDNPPVPADTPGARQCLECSQAFAADVSGTCPACRGTLAPARQGSWS